MANLPPVHGRYPIAAVPVLSIAIRAPIVSFPLALLLTIATAGVFLSQWLLQSGALTRDHHARLRARDVAVTYFGWKGNDHHFEFSSQAFAVAFMQANRQRLINVGSEAESLLANPPALPPLPAPPPLSVPSTPGIPSVPITGVSSRVLVAPPRAATAPASAPTAGARIDVWASAPSAKSSRVESAGVRRGPILRS